MNSILLKTTSSGEEVAMYGFERLEEFIHDKSLVLERNILFSGSKEELLSKEEEFFFDVVEWEVADMAVCSRVYYELDLWSCNWGNSRFTVKDSMVSALFCLTHNNYILIIKRKS